MKKFCSLGLLMLLAIFVGCSQSNNDDPWKTVEKQYLRSTLKTKATKEGRVPRTIRDNKLALTHKGFDWTLGFYSGTLWNLYKKTGDEAWKKKAIAYTMPIKKHQFVKHSHDLGFVFMCSFGHMYEENPSEETKTVLVNAARSLASRFSEKTGCIQSWGPRPGRGWKYPVIIDNMMNLELLFEASKMSGDKSLYNLAVRHADTTLKNHFRPDGSSYHVVDYNPETGDVHVKETAQGFANNSAWARGQAWAIYGYTVSYRYTKQKKYLEQAIKTFNFVKNHKNLPKDLIPYWDFDCTDIPNTPRDASAAAIIASALYELNEYDQSFDYRGYADRMVASLSSENYLAKEGENQNFALMHSVGSIPHKVEIDVPLNYADYYFTEALLRKENAVSK